MYIGQEIPAMGTQTKPRPYTYVYICIYDMNIHTVYI